MRAQSVGLRWAVLQSPLLRVGMAFVVSASITSSSASLASSLAPKPPTVRVNVTNDGPADVVVYAYRGGAKMRIGFVTGHSHARVTVPPGMANPGRVQLLLHPEPQGEDFIVEEVAIQAGEEHAELHVLPVLDESSMTVVPGTGA